MNSKSLSDDLVSHQYIYVPWIDEHPIYEIAAPLALHLQKHFHAPLTVVCQQKSGVPELLRKSAVVTERSGDVRDGGIVLVYCPSNKLMDKISRLEKSIVVLVEWANTSHSGWAKLHEAFDVSNERLMESDLNDGARKTLDAIVFEGYNGWNDRISEISTHRLLRDLTDAGGYDREVVLAFARVQRGESGIQRLYKLLDEFDLASRL
jgi:hypothetical protein